MSLQEIERSPRAIVVEDMLDDLFTQVRDNAAFPFKMSVNRTFKSDDPSFHAWSIAHGPDVNGFVDENPNCGQAELSEESTFARITEVTTLVGKIGLYRSMGQKIYTQSLKVNGRRTWPDMFREIWAADYAERMTKAIYLGLDHTVQRPQETR
jgi:hypothetical protein